jgi:predicted  nucleic acid-binding Zn-ribbon protein
VKEWKEVKELRGKLLGMEMELSLISKDLERFKMELSFNQNVLVNITENIMFLKKSKAAVSLNEYKKIKQQKSLIEKRIFHYRNKITPLQKDLASKEKVYNENMELFKKMYKQQFKNNVLEFPNVRRQEK